MDTEEDSRPETSVKNPEKFKAVNWVQWSKEFENYVAQYKTPRKTRVLLSYIINNNSKRPDAADISLLPQM